MRLVAALLLASIAVSARAERLMGFGGVIVSYELGDIPPVMVEVPSCAALDEAACVAAVEGEGFVATVVERCSDTVALGDAIGTVPPAGTEIEEGSAVSVLVSNGAMCPASGGSGKRFGIGIGIEVN